MYIRIHRWGMPCSSPEYEMEKYCSLYFVHPFDASWFLDPILVLEENFI